MNSFQKWAIHTLQTAGFHASPLGNWIEIAGESIMSVDGVRRYIQSRA